MRIQSETFVKALQKGDDFIAIASSFAIERRERILNGIKVLEKWGLKSRPSTFLERRWGYLAGDDTTRHNELYPQLPPKLIACARGGWGAARLLEKPQSWKKGWFLGYSDATALLWARLAAGFDGGIHGPLLNSLSKEPEWSQERLKSILFGETVEDLKGEGWRKGIAIGPLIAGNLSVITHLLGSSYIPELSGAILILEDIDEEPYKVDRMLTHLRLTGLLSYIGGLGFGDFQKCEAPKEIPINETFQLEEVLKDRSLDLQIPVVGKLSIGHCCGNAALPLGRNAILNGNTGLLSLYP